MKIKTKLIVGYVVVALISAVGGYFAIHMVRSVNAEFRRQAEDEIPLNQSLQDLKYAGLRVVSSTMEYAFLRQHSHTSPEAVKGMEEEKELISTGRKSYDLALKRYEAELRRHADLTHELPSVQHIKEPGDSLMATSDAIIKAAEQDLPHEKIAKLKEINEEAEERFLHVIEIQFRENALDFARSRMQTYYSMQWALRNIFIITGSSLALALISGIVISGSISRRLAALEKAAQRIGEGDLEAEIDVTSADEIGTLSAAFKKMAGDLAATSREIRAGKDFLNEIINSMMDALIVVSPEGKVQSVNCEACSMLRYDEEPVGRDFSAIMPDFVLEELIERGYMREMEKAFVAADGKQIPVAFSGSILWNADGSMRGVVCVAQDITRRKQAEAELQRFTEELLASNEELKRTETRLQRYAQNLQETNDELKSFAYIISHDLRAPLVNIKGFTGELKENLAEITAITGKCIETLEKDEGTYLKKLLEEDVPEAFNFINFSVTRMDSLINLVLRLYRLGHRELKPELVDLNVMVNEILQTLAHQLEEKDAEVTVGRLPGVFQDKVALEHIFPELLLPLSLYRR